MEIEVQLCENQQRSPYGRDQYTYCGSSDLVYFYLIKGNENTKTDICLKLWYGKSAIRYRAPGKSLYEGQVIQDSYVQRRKHW